MKHFFFTFSFAFFVLAGINPVYCQDSLNIVKLPNSQWDSIKNSNIKMSVFANPFNHIIVYEQIGTGYGAGIEYYLGKKSSVHLPIVYLNNEDVKGLIVSPGLKLYPYGYKHVITWSIGSNLTLGRLKLSDYHRYKYNIITQQRNVSATILGFDLQNTLKVRVRKLYFEFANSIGMIHAKEHSIIVNSNIGIGINIY